MYFGKILQNCRRLLIALGVSLAFSTSAFAVFEIEPNNSIATANTESLGAHITGQLSSYTDVDYFGVTLTSSGVLNIFYEAPSSAFWGATISAFNSSGTLLGSWSTSNNATYQVAAPTPGNYYVKISTNSYLYDSGNYSLTITGLTLPGAPTNLSATAGNASAVISFTAPSNSGGTTISTYTVTSSPGTVTATGSSSPITITGLSNNTSYTFTVTATNVVGVGSASDSSNSATPFIDTSPPTVPTGFTAVATSSTHIALNWEASTDNVGVTSYKIYSGATFVATLAGNVLTSIRTNTPNSIYTYYVSACDAAGNCSALTSGITVTTPGPGGAPTNVSATAGNQNAVINFSAPSFTGNSAITGYTVTSSPGGKTVTGISSPLTITGLTNGTAYTFTVVSINAYGNSASSTASNPITPAAPITAPGVPTSISAAPGNASATLTFTAPSSNGGAAISVYTVTSSGGQTTTGTGSPITVNGLTNGIAYTFTVTATNSAGVSLASSASNSVTPVAPTTSVPILSGWNLVGNSFANSVAISTMFTNPSQVISVWKWDSKTLGWAFYAPSYTLAELASYAANQGYEVLSTINPGDGFWINAAAPFALQIPGGTPVLSTSYLSTGSLPLNSGWSLISIGETKTPSAFNLALSLTPPSSGTIPINVTSIWAWDATYAKWFFYSPLSDSSGTLQSYISLQGYETFTTSTLTQGVGFWVNMPSN